MSNSDDDIMVIEEYEGQTESDEESTGEYGHYEHYDEDSEIEFVTERTPVSKALLDDITRTCNMFKQVDSQLGVPPAVIKEDVSKNLNECHVYLTFEALFLSRRLQELWELESPYITFVIERVDRVKYRNALERPVVRYNSTGNEKSVVGEQLKNFMVMKLESYSANSGASCPFSFLELYSATHRRFRTLTQYCINCNNELYQGGVTPSVCDRPLCAFQFHELRLYDGLTIPRVQPELLHVLLLSFFSALLSDRNALILMPAPELDEEQLKKLFNETFTFKHEKPKHALYNTHTKKDLKTPLYNTLRDTMKGIPCPRLLLSDPPRYHAFKQNSPHTGRFIEWLIFTNRAYIERVPRAMRVNFFGTNDQFLFVADSPAKQETFKKLKDMNGGKTRFLFHGSPIENWHSIMRNGVKVMSNTKYMVCAAAYGAGVYLSPRLEFSATYAKPGGLYPPTQCACPVCLTKDEALAQCTYIIALVEVIDDRTQLKKCSEDIYLLANDDYCCVRMLLLYNTSVGCNLNSMSKNDVNAIHEMVKKFQGLSLLDRATLYE